MFDSLIGQDTLKRKLEFYVRTHKVTNVAPPVIFQAPKGIGKTAFCRAFSKKLCEDADKVYAEINCASIKNNKQFFEQIFPQFNGTKVVMFFDEAHKLPYDLQNDFLTILNTETSDVITYDWRGTPFTFDFKKWTFLLGTTDPQAISSALRDRLTTLDFEEYTVEDICKMIERHAAITFDDGLLEEISSTCRGNPRSAVLRAKDIRRYTDEYGAAHFDRASWEDLKQTLAILPFGLTNDEKKILDILKTRGPSTLTSISSIMGATKGYTQMLESHLLKNGLISIDGSPVKRSILPKGVL